MSEIPPVLLVGVGKMGAALFGGWCRAGLAPSALVEPHAAALGRPGDVWVADISALPGSFTPAIALLAVKPQVAPALLEALNAALPPACPVLSIMAGIRLDTLAAALGGRPVIRAMPNTPASIGQGMTVACAATAVGDADRGLCARLLGAVGDVAWIDDEALMDPVTAVSGSGPAYIFLLAELLEQAAIEQGIPPGLARRLARQTVAGAGALLASSDQDAAALRHAVTSPGGTTAAALAVMMEPGAWPAAVSGAVRAAVARARVLGK